MHVDSRPSLASIAVALAAGIAMFAYADALVDPAAAAESHFLALWATLILVILAGLVLPPAYDLVVPAVLATLAVWVVPHGPVRGATVGLLLTLALVTTALRHLDGAAPKISLSWAVTVALGLQILCRAERLLVVSLDSAISIGVLVLPLGAGIAIMLIQHQRGTPAALLAAATSAMLVPGWSVTVTLSLLVVALGLLWRDREVPRGVVAGVAVLLLLAASFWHPTLFWLLFLTFLAAANPASWKTGSALLVAVALLLAFVPAARDWSEVLRLLSMGPLLLPALLLPATNRRASAVRGLLLAVLALRTVGGPGALAAPLALVALAVRSGSLLAHLQMVWSATLLTVTVLLAAYPWLRNEPLGDALALLGIKVGWPAASVVVGLVWVLSLLCAALDERSGRFQCRPVVVAAVVLTLAVWFSLPGEAVYPLADQKRVLSESEPEMTVVLDPPTSTTTVIIDTYVDNSTMLATGTPVARLTLIAADEERQSWLLRLGYETGEWAARRADVASLPGFQSPSHWVTWISPDRETFAQRYRARWSLEKPIEISRVEIARVEDLPREASLAIFHLELRQ